MKLMKDRLKELVPELASIKRHARDGETFFWEVFNEGGERIGYAFYIVVPETDDPSLQIAEFDKYEVLCLVNHDFTIESLDICEHPDGPDRMWAAAIVEPEFESQYLGLGVGDLALAPEGKIDAISDGTLSSKIVTNAIQRRVQEIREAIEA
jgi:hypothetical protein